MMKSLPMKLAWALLVSQASAHTWVEQMSVIKNGVFSGASGYIRNFMARTEPGFNDDRNEWLVPSLESGRTKIDHTDLMCSPYQRKMEQAAGLPRLQASPGDYIALKYLENGHVTQPWNQLGKPERGGTVFVYGTNEPDLANEKLLNVFEWNVHGTGGDKRGRLLGASNFDDLRCHQVNPASPIAVERMKIDPDSDEEQWCETDIKIPDDAPNGQPFTIYWVWQWPTIGGVDPGLPDGKDEYYTSCADIDIGSNTTAPTPATAAAADTGVQSFEDAQSKAVDGWKAREALVINPNKQDYKPYSSGIPGPTGGTNVIDFFNANPPAPTSQAPVSSTATPAPTVPPTNSPEQYYTTLVTTVMTITVPIPSDKAKRAATAPSPSPCAAHQDAQPFCHGTAHAGVCKEGLIVWTTLGAGERCEGESYVQAPAPTKRGLKRGSAKFRIE